MMMMSWLFFIVGVLTQYYETLKNGSEGNVCYDSVKNCLPHKTFYQNPKPRAVYMWGSHVYTLHTTLTRRSRFKSHDSASTKNNVTGEPDNTTQDRSALALPTTSLRNFPLFWLGPPVYRVHSHLIVLLEHGR